MCQISPVASKYNVQITIQTQVFGAEKKYRIIQSFFPKNTTGRGGLSILNFEHYSSSDLEKQCDVRVLQDRFAWNWLHEYKNYFRWKWDGSRGRGEVGALNFHLASLTDIRNIKCLYICHITNTQTSYFYYQLQRFIIQDEPKLSPGNHHK